MAGSLRYRRGAWRLQVRAGRDPATGRDRFVTRVVHEPNTRPGRRKAEAELARLLVEVEQATTAPRADLTVDDLVARWIAARSPSWSPGTVRETVGLAARYVTPTIGRRPVYRIRGHDLDGLYADLLGRGLAPATVRKVHATMRAAFGQAVRWGLIATNPATAATPPHVPKPEIATPDAARLARLLEGIADDPAWSAWVRVAISTGARRGQVCALQWRDVDLDAGTVTYRRALSLGAGAVVVKGTKTGREYTVAVGRATRDALERLWWSAVEVHAECGSMPGPESWLFERVPGGDPWRPDSTSRRWRQLRARYGLDGVKLHALRHFMATELLAAGVDVRTVAGRGGWSNPSTPLNTYARFVPPADQAAAALIDEIIDRG